MDSLSWVGMQNNDGHRAYIIYCVFLNYEDNPNFNLVLYNKTDHKYISAIYGWKGLVMRNTNI